MHESQVEVTGDVVRLLVDEQFPHWRQLLLWEVAPAGTDNAIFRIGDDLVARFPLHAQETAEAWASLEAEARALEEPAAAARSPPPYLSRWARRGYRGCTSSGCNAARRPWGDAQQAMPLTTMS